MRDLLALLATILVATVGLSNGAIRAAAWLAMARQPAPFGATGSYRVRLTTPDSVHFLDTAWTVAAVPITPTGRWSQERVKPELLPIRIEGDSAVFGAIWRRPSSPRPTARRAVPIVGGCWIGPTTSRAPVRAVTIPRGVTIQAAAYCANGTDTVRVR